MKKLIIFCPLLIVNFLNHVNYVKALDINSNYDYYTAGVVEYDSTSERENFPAEYVRNNVEAYLHFIDMAKEQNVDILVFPEATFNYFSKRSTMIENAILLPDPSEKIAPWERNEYSEHLKAISKKCKDQQIYVLINLVEKVPCTMSDACKHPNKAHKDGYDLFNTNVVLDRQGRVISKYQKYNLFIEPLVDQPIMPQHSVFMTDFGVKFGHFICFDILFQEPAMSLIQEQNITNILFPSMWFPDMPFLTSNQIHQGWAFTNNVNLLSSGASNPKDGSSGSGIFIGRHRIAQSLVSPFPTQKLLTAIVPKDPRKFNVEDKQFGGGGAVHISNKFTPIQMQNLHITEFWAEEGVHAEDITSHPQTICTNDDNICCDFDIQMKTNEIPPGKIAYKYKLVVNYTTRLFGLNKQSGEVYCSVVACKNDDSKSCGKRFKNNSNLFNAVEFERISIKAKIKYNNPTDLLIMPNSLDTSISPLDISRYNFELTKDELQKRQSFKEFRMYSENKITDLLTFGIYGRNFALDRVVPSKYIRG